MLVEGKNPVTELLDGSDVTIEKIVAEDKTADGEVRTIIGRARSQRIRVEFLPRKAMDRLSVTGHHQGIIAVVTEFKYADLDECIAAPGKKFFVLLDKLSDPHNLGSIIRTAECAGVSAVVIPARNSVLVNETVIRSSAGATSHVKVCKVGNLNDAIDKLKAANIFVYATDMDGQSIYKTDLTGNIAIVIGSEGNGIGTLTAKKADAIISIPMFGKINSLNASVSAAIVMYEVVRQGEKL